MMIDNKYQKDGKVERVIQSAFPVATFSKRSGWEGADTNGVGVAA